MFLGESAICLILGTLSGYPMGAKLACNLKESKVCTKYEAERLIAFTNNSGPLFVIATVGISMFHSKEIGFYYYLLTYFLLLLLELFSGTGRKIKMIFLKDFYRPQKKSLISLFLT